MQKFGQGDAGESGASAGFGTDGGQGGNERSSEQGGGDEDDEWEPEQEEEEEEDDELEPVEEHKDDQGQEDDGQVGDGVRLYLVFFNLVQRRYFLVVYHIRSCNVVSARLSQGKGEGKRRAQDDGNPHRGRPAQRTGTRQHTYAER